MVMSIKITPIRYAHRLYNKGTNVIKFNQEFKLIKLWLNSKGLINSPCM